MKAKADMAMGWVNPWVGLGWVEDFHNYSGLGWSPQHDIQRFSVRTVK